MNRRHGPHRLVVSDDPTLRRMLCSVLTVFDCDAEAAGDGGDALVRLASSAYDVVCLCLSLDRSVGPTVGRPELRRPLTRPLPDHPSDSAEVIDELIHDLD